MEYDAKDREYSLDKIDAFLMEMRLKIDWIDTGKASKYKEVSQTYNEIYKLAMQIAMQCSEEIGRLNQSAQ